MRHCMVACAQVLFKKTLDASGLFKSPGGEKKRVIFAKLAKQINSARKRMTRMDYNTLMTEEEEQRLSRVPVTALYEALGQVKMDARNAVAAIRWPCCSRCCC